MCRVKFIHISLIPLNYRSRDGLGRSCVVGATLMLQTNDNLTYSDAFDAIKKVIGPRAIQTVKVKRKYIEHIILNYERRVCSSYVPTFIHSESFMLIAIQLSC